MDPTPLLRGTFEKCARTARIQKGFYANVITASGSARRIYGECGGYKLSVYNNPAPPFTRATFSSLIPCFYLLDEFENGVSPARLPNIISASIL